MGELRSKFGWTDMVVTGGDMCLSPGCLVSQVSRWIPGQYAVLHTLSGRGL